MVSMHCEAITHALNITEHTLKNQLGSVVSMHGKPWIQEMSLPQQQT